MTEDPIKEEVQAPEQPAEKKKIGLSPHLKKKFLLMLPLFAIPLVVLIFWAAKSRKQKGEELAEGSKESAINASLPNPRNQGLPVSKLEAYINAERDSLERKNKEEAERKIYTSLVSPGDDGETVNVGKGINTTPALYQREDEGLRQINTTLKNFEQERSGNYRRQPSRNNDVYAGYRPPEEYETLEARNRLIQNDPNLKQLYNRLDKLMAQTDTTRKEEEKEGEPARDGEEDEPVRAEGKKSVVSSLINAKSASGSFYGLLSASQKEKRLQNAVAAAIHNDQVITDESTVKLRLSEPLVINDETTLPQHSFIYGVASIANDRLQIRITSVQYEGSIHKVKLNVWDNDGLAGIHLPENTAREAAKQSAGQMAQGPRYNVSVSQNLGQQLAMTAAQTTVDGVKQFLSKKARTPKVHLKAGYKVLLTTKA